MRSGPRRLSGLLLSFGLLFLLVGALPGCNMMEGAGDDLEEAGDNISDAADGG